MELSRAALIDRLLLKQEIEDFHADYATALDEQRLDDWAEMFTEDAFYVILSKENADRNMPVGLIYCEGRGMLRDRAFALKKTAMFAPRYTRHIISNIRCEDPAANGIIAARANYIVLQVVFDNPIATLHQIGIYEDKFQRVGGVLKLASRRCIYDNLLVDNALCLPV